MPLTKRFKNEAESADSQGCFVVASAVNPTTTSSTAENALPGLLTRAGAHLEKGDLACAFDAAEHALAAAQRSGDRAAEADALWLRGSAASRLGLQRDASQDIERALALARADGHAGLVARCLRLISNFALEEGNEEQARELLDQSLDVARRVGDDEQAFWALNNITNLLGIQAARHAQAGEPVLARERVAELRQIVGLAQAVAKRTGHWLHHAFALSNLADAYIVEGHHERARALVAEYAALAARHAFARLMAYANLDEVRMLRAEGKLDEAIAVIDAQAHDALLPGNDDIALSTQKQRYELHKAGGRYELALQHLERLRDMDIARLQRRSEQQVGVMMARLELEQARAAAERALHDAALLARRAESLELDRDRLHRVAHEDPLTRTGNRRAAESALARHFAAVDTGKPKPIVALVDIDHFKRINDTFGHAIGDAVLAALGPLMRESLRRHDEVFRFGGEEFLLLLHDTSEAAGLDACNRLRANIEKHDWHAVCAGLAVTASVGMTSPGAGDDAQQALQRADAALYAAKSAGRNHVQLR